MMNRFHQDVWLEPTANLAVTPCSIKLAVHLNLCKYLVCFDTPLSIDDTVSFA